MTQPVPEGLFKRSTHIVPEGLHAWWAAGMAVLMAVLCHPAHAQQVVPPLGPQGIACAYNSSPPVVTAGQAVWVQCDNQGHMIVSPGGGNAGTYTTTAYTVGTTDGTVTGTSAATAFLMFHNVSPSATICLNFNATATISNTTCAAGEITLFPGWLIAWPLGGTNLLPSVPLHAIASAASTPATVGVK